MTRPGTDAASHDPDGDDVPERSAGLHPAPGATVQPAILSRWGSRGTAAVLGIGALVILLVGATAGLVLSRSGPEPVSVSTDGQDQVDTGFARDMVVHHTQGVLMAHIAEMNSADREIGLVAYDIAFSQTSQIGMMQGWLDLWGVPRLSGDAHMSWMGPVGMADMADMTGMAGMAGTSLPGTISAATATSGQALSDGAVMPGMATDAEIDRLHALRGPASDTLFLQLMIRHHEGGEAMMTYAADHAASPVVQNLASKMLESQKSEIGVMTGMLAARGAEPLPFAMPTG